jgi:hypothetical protein
MLTLAADGPTLSHHQFVQLDLDTRVRHGREVRIIYRRRPSLQNELPQLDEVLTPIVEIRKGVSSQDSLTGPMPLPSHGAAKSGPEFRTVLDMAIAIPGNGNFVREVPLGRVGFDCVMAAYKVECADQTAIAAAIAQAAFDPTLAIPEEFQQQIENSDGFGGVACGHMTPPGSG